jgi:hypothetical protein
MIFFVKNQKWLLIIQEEDRAVVPEAVQVAVVSVVEVVPAVARQEEVQEV